MGELYHASTHKESGDMNPLAKEVENNPSLLKQYKKMIEERDKIV